MATYAKILVLLISALIFVGEIQFSSSQNCGCANGLCCSKYGYCGTTEAYCGDGCQQGPCTSKPIPSPSVPAPSGSIESIITQDFFNRIKSGIFASCEGSNFYTYNGFISAAKASNFAGFGTTGSLDVQKRELTAFFANVAHETGNLCYVEEIEKRHVLPVFLRISLCEWKAILRTGASSVDLVTLFLKSITKTFLKFIITTDAIVKFYSTCRNYNYGAAGKYVGLPLLNNLDLVAQQPDVALKTSLWFWMVNSDCHNAMTSNGKGFAGTIRAINGGECDGGRPAAVEIRVSSYQKFCGWLGVATGPNLSC